MSPGRINFEVPLSTATGNATLMLDQKASLGNVWIAATAPALFSANGDGEGVAAATAVRVFIPSTLQAPVTVFTCARTGNCTSVPIQLGVDTPIYVSFYGTGIRGSSSLTAVSLTIGGVSTPVLYAGPQGTYPGLDQVNVALPLTLHGVGEVDVVLTVDGQTSNTVRIAVQ